MIFLPDPKKIKERKANCARSGIPERTSERILGHSNKKGRLTGNLPVAHRYGAISDTELVAAIDQLTFDHGYSEIDGQPLILNPVSYLLAGDEKTGYSFLRISG